MLYVLDEPCIGLHPADVPQLVNTIQALRDRGNTVAVIEHDPLLIRAADEVVELGPGAGEFGGTNRLPGHARRDAGMPDSRTGDWLVRPPHVGTPRGTAAAPIKGAIRLDGARGNNLQNLTSSSPGRTVRGNGREWFGQRAHSCSTHCFPPSPGVSRIEVEKPATFDEILGAGQLEDAVLIDQSPIGRTPRSNPVTYIKAFDPIRACLPTPPRPRPVVSGRAISVSMSMVVAAKPAKAKAMLQIDMRLMADVYMHCAECQGQRFRHEVLDVKYRGL